MSGREWQPGDVAVATVRTVRVVQHGARVVRYDTGSERGWWTSGTDRYHSDQGVTDLRPLVVIDPEDREQAERLDAAIAAAYSDAPLGVDRATPMQAALREFANPTPPKPEEPTSLAARVVDRDGLAWARRGDDWLPLGSGKFAGLDWASLCDRRGPLGVEA